MSKTSSYSCNHQGHKLLLWVSWSHELPFLPSWATQAPTSATLMHISSYSCHPEAYRLLHLSTKGTYAHTPAIPRSIISHSYHPESHKSLLQPSWNLRALIPATLRATNPSFCQPGAYRFILLPCRSLQDPIPAILNPKLLRSSSLGILNSTSLQFCPCCTSQTPAILRPLKLLHLPY